MIALTAIKLPENFNTMVSTGNEAVDQLFGSDSNRFGFVTGKTYLISAPPGTGKTRLFLTISSEISENNPEIKTAHFTGEQSVNDLKSITDKMGLRINDRMFIDQEDKWDNIKAKVLQFGIKFVVIDSLPMLEFAQIVDEDTKAKRDMSVKEKMKAIAEFVTQNNVIMVLINHTTKGGKWGGRNEIMHLVDVSIVLSVNTKDYEGVKVVEFHGGKNREGSPISRGFPFNGTWDLTMPYEIAEASDGGENNHKRVAELKATYREDILNTLAIRDNQTVTREEINAMSFIAAPASSIISILRELVDENLVTAHREHTGKRGQPPITSWSLVIPTVAEDATMDMDVQ